MNRETAGEPGYYPYLLNISKEGAASYIGHLDFFRAVERALYRCDAPVKMSEGFNPKPKIEFANPLSLGAGSRDEVVLVEMTAKVDVQTFSETFNQSICEGIRLEAIFELPVEKGRKKHTLMKKLGAERTGT